MIPVADVPSDLPLFDFKHEIRSKFKRRVTERTAIIAINKWLARCSLPRVKYPLGFACSAERHLGCWVWPFKSRDGYIYLFGDMYCISEGLRAFFTDLKLEQHTSFYEWKDAACYNDMGDGRMLSIHRAYVFVTKIPADLRRIRMMGLFRCVPMLMLWRKRATERLYHPSRIDFSIIKTNDADL